MTQQSSKDSAKRKMTPYHEYLGTLFKLFDMQDVEIKTPFPVAKEIPKGDILILLRKGKKWTDEQRRYLPDGVRDGNARHKLLEFKYTESFNEAALDQTIGYNIAYGRSHQLSQEEYESYLLVSRTPNEDTLQSFGFEETALPGVYRSSLLYVKKVTLLVLNDLRDEPHNAYMKLFASRKKVKLKAAQQLRAMDILDTFTQLGAYLRGLVQLFFKEGEMNINQREALLPEELMEMGREMGKDMMKSYWDELTPEEKLNEFDVDPLLEIMSPERRMAGLPPERRMAGLPPEQRMAGLPPEQRMAGLPPEQRMAGLPPEQRMAGLRPEQRMAGLPLEMIEAYLQNIKYKGSGS